MCQHFDEHNPSFPLHCKVPHAIHTYPPLACCKQPSEAYPGAQHLQQRTGNGVNTHTNSVTRLGPKAQPSAPPQCTNSCSSWQLETQAQPAATTRRPLPQALSALLCSHAPVSNASHSPLRMSLCFTPYGNHQHTRSSWPPCLTPSAHWPVPKPSRNPPQTDLLTPAARLTRKYTKSFNKTARTAERAGAPGCTSSRSSLHISRHRVQSGCLKNSVCVGCAADSSSDITQV